MLAPRTAAVILAICSWLAEPKWEGNETVQHHLSQLLINCSALMVCSLLCNMNVVIFFFFLHLFAVDTAANSQNMKRTGTNGMNWTATFLIPCALIPCVGPVLFVLTNEWTLGLNLFLIRFSTAVGNNLSKLLWEENSSCPSLLASHCFSKISTWHDLQQTS